MASPSPNHSDASELKQSPLEILVWKYISRNPKWFKKLKPEQQRTMVKDMCSVVANSIESEGLSGSENRIWRGRSVEEILDQVGEGRENPVNRKRGREVLEDIDEGIEGTIAVGGTGREVCLDSGSSAVSNRQEGVHGRRNSSPPRKGPRLDLNSIHENIPSTDDIPASKDAPNPETEVTTAPTPESFLATAIARAEAPIPQTDLKFNDPEPAPKDIWILNPPSIEEQIIDQSSKKTSAPEFEQTGITRSTNDPSNVAPQLSRNPPAEKISHNAPTKDHSEDFFLAFDYTKNDIWSTGPAAQCFPWKRLRSLTPGKSRPSTAYLHIAIGLGKDPEKINKARMWTKTYCISLGAPYIRSDSGGNNWREGWDKSLFTRTLLARCEVLAPIWDIFYITEEQYETMPAWERQRQKTVRYGLNHYLFGIARLANLTWTSASCPSRNICPSEYSKKMDWIPFPVMGPKGYHPSQGLDSILVDPTVRKDWDYPTGANSRTGAAQSTVSAPPQRRTILDRVEIPVQVKLRRSKRCADRKRPNYRECYCPRPCPLFSQCPNPVQGLNGASTSLQKSSRSNTSANIFAQCRFLRKIVYERTPGNTSRALSISGQSLAYSESSPDSAHQPSETSNSFIVEHTIEGPAAPQTPSVTEESEALDDNIIAPISENSSKASSSPRKSNRDSLTSRPIQEPPVGLEAQPRPDAPTDRYPTPPPRLEIMPNESLPTSAPTVHRAAQDGGVLQSPDPQTSSPPNRVPIPSQVPIVNKHPVIITIDSGDSTPILDTQVNRAITIKSSPDTTNSVNHEIPREAEIRFQLEMEKLRLERDMIELELRKLELELEVKRTRMREADVERMVKVEKEVWGG